MFAPVNQVRETPQFASSDDPMLADVRNLVKRPKFLETFTPGGTPPSYNLNWAFFNDNFQIGTRFAGALGFRATTCFRVVLAAAPQVGGVGRLYYNPADHDATVLSSYRNTGYMEKPNYYTQLPGVEIDFAKSTAVDFKVKYTSYLEYMPIVSSVDEVVQNMSLGSVNYAQYLDVSRDPSTESPKMSIYTWLEDLEIIGARNPDLTKTDFEAGSVLNFYSMSMKPADLDGLALGQMLRITNTGAPTQVATISMTGGTFNNEECVVEGYISRDVNANWTGAITYSTPSGVYVSHVSFVSGITNGLRVKWPSVQGLPVELTAEFTTFSAKDVEEVVSQSGIGAKLEEDIERDGPLSGPLYAASRVARVVGKIPILSAIARPVSWATRVASNVVAAFGYSRPLQLEHNSRFWPSQNHYQNNADGPDTSFNMGLLQDNKLAVIPNMGGVDVDEMAIDFVSSRPAFMGYFKLSSAVSGLRSVIALCPEAMYSTPTIPTSTTIMNRPPVHWLDPANSAFSSGLQIPFMLSNGQPIDTTPNFMLGTLFKYFRGGFKFKVKCNKTRFHAGRLALVFTPYTDISHADRKLYVPNHTDMDLYSQVTIWDLREDNEIEFSCPYVYNKPYCEVGEPYGVFTIHVVDRLTHPENVDEFVDFAIEVVAMEDMEYAFPTPGDYIVDPAVDYRSEQVNGFKLPESELVVAQSGVVIDQGNNDTIEPDCACIGERILSLKQVISRAEWSSLYPFLKADSPVMLPTWFEIPHFVGKYVDQGGNHRYVGSFKKSSRSIINSCYLFARGSTCYDIVSFDQTPLSGTSSTVTEQRPETFVTIVNETNPSNGLLGSGSVIYEPGPYSHVKVPFYSQTKKVMVNPCMEDINKSDLGSDYQSFKSQDFARAALYSPPNSKFSVRAGDDAQLAYFLCSAPLVYARGGPFHAPSLGTASAIGGAVDAYQLVPRFTNYTPVNP
jgi:hypothetical protein